MGVQLNKAGFDLGIVTNNGDAMLEFYRDVLGFEFEATLNMEAVGISAMHRVWADQSLLKIVVPVKPVDAGPQGGMMGANGMRYFTISVTNLDEVLAECETAGATIIWTKREIRPGVEVGMVEDPDGNWVEFIQTS